MFEIPLKALLKVFKSPEAFQRPWKDILKAFKQPFTSLLKAFQKAFYRLSKGLLKDHRDHVDKPCQAFEGIVEQFFVIT